MTYEEIVEKARLAYEDVADAREIFEHIAIQVNIEGEGHGAFYVEVVERQIVVEPYEYHDRDGLVFGTAEQICRILDGEISFADAWKNGIVRVQGNEVKLHMLEKIRFSKEALQKKKDANAKKAKKQPKKAKQEKSGTNRL